MIKSRRSLQGRILFPVPPEEAALRVPAEPLLPPVTEFEVPPWAIAPGAGPWGEGGVSLIQPPLGVQTFLQHRVPGEWGGSLPVRGGGGAGGRGAPVTWDQTVGYFGGEWRLANGSDAFEPAACQPPLTAVVANRLSTSCAPLEHVFECVAPTTCLNLPPAFHLTTERIQVQRHRREVSRKEGVLPCLGRSVPPSQPP